MKGMAPETAVGVEQIIPTLGEHEQILADHETIEALVVWGLVRYEPDYGPNAKVYRPVEHADADKVRSWIA